MGGVDYAFSLVSSGFTGANNGTCDGAGCCTPFCDLTAPVCPDGLECLAFYEEGQAPQCFEDVGVCFPPP